MPYVRTARACAWVDAEAIPKPEKFVPSAGGTRWAKKPWPSQHGLCIGLCTNLNGVFVAVQRTSATYWFPVDQVLHTSELVDWKRTGFGEPLHT